MATPVNFDPVHQSALRKMRPNKELDEALSPTELVRRQYETLCRLSGVLASEAPGNWIRHLRADLHSDRACVFLPGPDGMELQVYAFDFPKGAETIQEGTAIAFESTIAGRVFQTGKLWAGTLEEAYTLFATPGLVMPTADFQAGCMLPLPGRQRLLGTLGLGRRAGGPYSEDELDFLMQVSKQVALAVENALAHEEIRELKDRLAQENVYLQEEIRSEINFEEIVGKSKVLQRLLKNVETVAPTGSTVLICGETGTGKELIARAIH